MPVVEVPGLGDVEFPEGTDQATMARAIRGKLAAQKELNSPKYDPTQDMGTGSRLLAGIGRGFSDIGRNVANITGFKSDQELKDAEQIDQALLDTGAGKIGSFLGETAALTPLTLGLSGVATGARAGSLAARALTNPLSRGAVEGAAQGAISSGPDSRLTGAAIGGTAGVVLPALGKGVSTAAHGLKRTPEAQRLLDEGVSLTPGQMNPKGWLNQAEEALQSAPVVGSAIKNARESAEDQWRRAVINRGAVTPIPGSGTQQELLDTAYKSFDPLYSQGKGFQVATTGTLPQALGRAIMDPGVFADDAARNKVGSYVLNQLTKLGDNPKTDDLLKIRSEIRAKARATDVDAEKDLLQAAEKQLTQAINFALPPNARAAVGHADTLYGVHKITEDAVAKARDRPGGFTPTMLSQAIKSATDKGAFARGGGRLRDLAQAGSQTFEVRSPPTGARLGVLGALGAASLAKPGVGLPLTAGIFGLAGTQTGRKLAAGQTAGQKALAKQIERAMGATPAQARELAAIYSRGLLTAAAVNE